ncbi:MAG: hypothetical protein EOM74_02795 [Methanomicrobia archaeon]|nr:hypothetical protein [Methanomicrobia archaeon]
MEKIIVIDGKEVPFKSSGAFLLRYRSQFGKDPLSDVSGLDLGLKHYAETGSLEKIDMVVLYNLIWTLAKTANPTIKPPMEWLDEFNEFPIDEILPEVQELMIQAFGMTKTLKNAQSAVEQ